MSTSASVPANKKRSVVAVPIQVSVDSAEIASMSMARTRPVTYAAKREFEMALGFSDCVEPNRVSKTRRSSMSSAMMRVWQPPERFCHISNCRSPSPSCLERYRLAPWPPPGRHRSCAQCPRMGELSLGSSQRGSRRLRLTPHRGCERRPAPVRCTRIRLPAGRLRGTDRQAGEPSCRREIEADERDSHGILDNG
jgi:hypothetical protein